VKPVTTSQPPTCTGGGTRAPASRGKEISWLEWLVAAVGLVLIVAVIAFMIVEANRDSETPRIGVRVDSVSVLGDGGYLVQFTAVNRGGASVAAVGVVAEVRDGAETETSRATMDYLPARSERRGGLHFTLDPRRGTLRLRAEGYQKP
jgi:uncharacterized protein (TIGR02588 family)